MAEKRTEITDLGEFGLIERVKSSFSLQNSTSLVGIGDDAALIACGEEYLLVTTDMLLESVHFDLSYMPLQHLGYKAVVANVSDIAAMNGKPEQVTVALAFSNRFSLEAIDSDSPAYSIYSYLLLNSSTPQLFTFQGQSK